MNILLPSILYGAELKGSSTYNDEQLLYMSLSSGFRGIDSAAIGEYKEQEVGLAVENSKIDRKEL